MGLFNKCEHIWVEQQRVITKAIIKGVPGIKGNGRVILDSSKGSTQILLKCEKCGDLATRDLVGMFPND